MRKIDYTTCKHYTGKRVCMIGNSCSGEMPCYDSGTTRVPFSREDNPIKKCEMCGKEFFPLNTRNVYCSKPCRDKRGYEVDRDNRRALREKT